MFEEYERRLISNSFAEIIRTHNSALEQLQSFRKEYPYLISPKVLELLEGNIKDNINVLYREMQNLNRTNGPHYEKKYVCKKCKEVYFTSLPDGLCDKCRGDAPDK